MFGNNSVVLCFFANPAVNKRKVYTAVEHKMIENFGLCGGCLHSAIWDYIGIVSFILGADRKFHLATLA